jgi:uncharacterized HAD superfamily protein
MEKEKIGFDLDSVICDTDEVIVQYLKDKFNLYLDRDKDFVCYDFRRNPNLSTYTAEHLEEIVHTGELFENPLPYKDVYEGFSLIRENDFNISIITSRGAKDNRSKVKRITFDWLDRHKIEYDAIYFARTGEKKNLIRDLNIKAFVEDRFDVINMILEECGPLPYGLVIMDYPWNRKYFNKNVDRVHTFMEACKVIIGYKNDGGINHG